MDRTLEPELMIEAEQVKAYAEADFEVPHNQFIELIREQLKGSNISGTVVDLGCGPGDISCRFASSFPQCHIDAVDGSEQMLKYGRLHLSDAFKSKIRFVHAQIPDQILPRSKYETIISNSLLHHLPDPQTLWTTVKRYGSSGARVFIMDLLRPNSKAEAEAMVLQYAANEPEILKRDFYYSLLAAFTLQELKIQLNNASLKLTLKQISDRHIFISGVL